MLHFTRNKENVHFEFESGSTLKIRLYLRGNISPEGNKMYISSFIPHFFVDLESKLILGTIYIVAFH